MADLILLNYEIVPSTYEKNQKMYLDEVSYEGIGPWQHLLLEPFPLNPLSPPPQMIFLDVLLLRASTTKQKYVFWKER